MPAGALHGASVMEASRYVQVEGRLLKLTHLSKVLYGETGFSKSDLIAYYRRLAPVVLPHLRNRAFTLKRFPDGVGGESFYQKSCPSHRPSWLATGEFQGVDLLFDQRPPELDLERELGRHRAAHELGPDRPRAASLFYGL